MASAGERTGALGTRRPAWLRVSAAILLGNVLGLSAQRAAQVFVPWLWVNLPGPPNVPVFMGLVAVSFISVAAPPVLIGAFGAWLAGRAQLWVGLACGLWSLSLIRSVPAAFPIASGLWYAPAVLVLLSGALGGWLMELGGRAAGRRPETKDE